MKHLFITGTDTGVGKTYVTALLLAELLRRGHRAAAFKPIACGAGGRHDAKIYRAMINHAVPLDTINPIYLRHALAPFVAARLECRPVNLRRIHSNFRLLAADFSPVLVEGAGGLLVPIKRRYFVANLARDLKLPVIIVARLGLGTINHTLLTVQAAQATGLKVRGIILNDTVGKQRGLAEKSNPATIQQLINAPVLGVVPHAARRIPAGIYDRLFP